MAQILTCNGKDILNENGCLIVQTSAVAQVLTLGFGSKRVEAVPGNRTLKIDRKLCWFLHKSRRIEFDWVAAILFEDNLFQDYNRRSITDFESLKVSLILKDQEKVHLFSFRGVMEIESFAYSPFTEFIFTNGTSATFTGKQSTVAAQYAQALSNMIQVPILKEMNF